MKKKLLICFAMTLCILGLSACGNKQTSNDFISEEQVKQEAEYICANMGELQKVLAASNMSMSDWLSMNGLDPAAYPADVAGMESWDAAAEEFGGYVSVLSDETEVTISDKKAEVEVKIQGDKTYKGAPRTATVLIVYTKDGYESISVSTDYTMGELMARAGMNTLLGMGTVFAVLILISLIIYCFNYIPKIQAAFQNKKAGGKSEVALDQVITQIVTQEEAAPEDDLELIAVIAAAIAASEGAASADGYVVRSIIRR